MIMGTKDRTLSVSAEALYIYVQGDKMRENAAFGDDAR